MTDNKLNHQPYIFKNPQDKMIFAHLFTSKLETCGTIGINGLAMYFYIGDVAVATYFKSIIGAGIIYPVLIKDDKPIYFIYVLDIDYHEDALLWVSELIIDKIRAPHMMNLFAAYLSPFINSKMQLPDGGNLVHDIDLRENLNHNKNKKPPLDMEITNEEDDSETNIKQLMAILNAKPKK
jgi:hypothetical protein